jgi:UDP-2,3-diacylglucosamine hydrolase
MFNNQLESHAAENSKPRIGLVAGWGSFPVEVAEKCLQDGCDLYVVGLREHADPRLQQMAKQFRWMGVAKLGGHIRFFRRHGVDRVALAGKLFKDRLLFQGWGWMGLLPDVTCLRAVGSIFWSRSRDARDDSILSSVVKAYEQSGISMVSVNEAAPKLLVQPGLITGTKIGSALWGDIQFGWKIARQMGGLDVGQGIIVKDQVILAVEAIEGTDAMIARTAQLCPRGGFTLVKVAKPEQDMRFDVPTIGPKTVEHMSVSGGRVIAVEANKTILVEREATIAAARKHGISIIALTEQQVMQGGVPTLQEFSRAA